MPDSCSVQEENLISVDQVVWLRVVSIKSEAGAVISVAQLGVRLLISLIASSLRQKNSADSAHLHCLIALFAHYLNILPTSSGILLRGGTTGAVQLKQLATDYSQQKHTTWADNYCSIKG